MYIATRDCISLLFFSFVSGLIGVESCALCDSSLSGFSRVYSDIYGVFVVSCEKVIALVMKKFRVRVHVAWIIRYCYEYAIFKYLCI